MFGQKRKRMEFEDVSDSEDTKPVVKNVKVEEEADRIILCRPSAELGALKSEDDATLDIKHPTPTPPVPVRFPVLIDGDSKITKGNSKEKYNLKQDDFDGLDFEEKPIIGQRYCAHLYDIVEIWQRAIERKRIPRDTPKPQVGLHYEPYTMAQVLVHIPGCAELDECFTPWIWRAIARHYERMYDAATFGFERSSMEITHQLRVAVGQELNKMYQRWPRTTAPLRPSQSAKNLQELLGRAPQCWAKDYKTQVNNAVNRVVTELGKGREMAARWLVYDKLAACNDGLHWANGRGRWVDNALEALEGPFKV